jgi:glucan 1,3-beta-glucosidase
MAGGLALALITFGVAFATLRRRPWSPRRSLWIAVALSATAAGILAGVAQDRMMFESYGLGRWLQWGALLACGILAPPLGAYALMSGRTAPTFVELLGPREMRQRGWLSAALTLILLATTLIAAQTALGFTFDPRYRDFPFASLTMAVLPFASLAILNRPASGQRPIAEAVFGGLLTVTAAYTLFNEGDSNWQSLWSGAVYLLLAATLWQARVARTPE